MQEAICRSVRLWSRWIYPRWKNIYLQKEKLCMRRLSQAAVKMQMGRLVKQQILNNYQKKNYAGCWKNFDRQACGSGTLNHLEVRKSGKRKLLAYIRCATKWHIRNGSAARNISRQPENYKA